MNYRDPLEAARARIAALEELLDSQDFPTPTAASPPGDRDVVRDLRASLAEERAERAADQGRADKRERELYARVEDLERELREERARRQAEVSLLRSKLEEAEREVRNTTSLFEAEQTIQRAEAEAAGARLQQTLAQRDTALRELREEVRVHLEGEAAEVRAYYGAKVRAVGTELAESGSLARRLEESLEQARRALAALPPADARDREGMVEREVARRKVAVGEAELARVKDRIDRLEAELSRITDAEARLASR